MGDLIRIMPGSAPWQPSPDSELIAEYSYFDFPTVGVVRQQGAEYLFRCIAGSDEDVSFWTFSLIQESDRKAIEAAPTRQDLERILDTIQAGHPITVALVAEGIGVVRHKTITYWHDDKTLWRALSELVHDVQEVATHANELADVELAGKEAKRSERQ